MFLWNMNKFLQLGRARRMHITFKDLNNFVVEIGGRSFLLKNLLQKVYWNELLIKFPN